MKVIVVYSPYPNAGKRTVIYNLLLIFARKNPERRILVVDVEHGSMKTELLLQDIGKIQATSDLLFEPRASSTMLLEHSLTINVHERSKKGWIKFLPPSQTQSLAERIPQDEHDFISMLEQRLEDFKQQHVELVVFILPSALHHNSTIYYFHVADYTMLVMRPTERDFKRFKNMLEDFLLFMPTRDLLILNKVQKIFFTPEDHVNFLTTIEKNLRIPIIFTVPFHPEMFQSPDDQLWALSDQQASQEPSISKIATIFLDIIEKDFNPPLRVVEPRSRPTALLVIDNHTGNALFSYFFEHSTVLRQPLLLGAALTSISTLITETTGAEANDHLKMIDNGRLKITIERGKELFTVLFTSGLDMKLIRIQQQFTKEADHVLRDDIKQHRLTGRIKNIENKLTILLEKHFKDYLSHIQAVSKELELLLERFMKEQGISDEKEAFKRFIKIHRNDASITTMLKQEYSTRHDWRHDMLKAAGISLTPEERQKMKEELGYVCSCSRPSIIYLLIRSPEELTPEIPPRFHDILESFKENDLQSIEDLKEKTGIVNEKELQMLMKELEMIGYIKSFRA